MKEGRRDGHFFPSLYAQKQKAKPSSPSQPPPDGHSPEARKNQKELHLISHNCPGPKSSPQASEAENNQEELHYAVLNFPGLRPWETQRPKGMHPEYAEIQFHWGSTGQRTWIQARERGRTIGKNRGWSLSLSLSLFNPPRMGHPIPDPSILEQLD